jgi:CBS domain-containing protein
MTEQVVTVDWLTSLDELVRDYVYRHQLTHYPVLNREELVGMVSLAQIRRVPREVWMFKQVRDLMSPIEDLPTLRPTDDATEALARMAAPEASPMLVLQDGHMVGIVSRRDILNFFKIKAELGAA